MTTMSITVTQINEVIWYIYLYIVYLYFLNQSLVQNTHTHKEIKTW